MNEVLNSAIQYANTGFKVFPLKENTKSGQVCRSWKEEATTNLEQINQWFSNTDYNVGVRTGDGLIVIDIDNKNDRNGYKSIEPFLKDFPPTRIVRTVNDGWHMYYLVNCSISCKVNLYDGIDIRGEGGYVVGIDSVIDGKTYKISYHEQIAEANDAVYKFLEGQKIKEKRMSNVNSIDEGQRNDYLFKMACLLQHKGLSDKAIEACLIEENQNKCNPPLYENEVIKIFRSSLRYEKGCLDIKEQSNIEGSYTVSQLLTSEENDEPGSRYELRRRYWTYALDFIHEAHGDGSFSNVNASKENWISGFIGVSGFAINCVANFDSARVELYLGKSNKDINKKTFDKLFSHKEEIEANLGTALIWNRNDEVKASKIFYQLDNVSIEKEVDWLQMARFHAEWSKKFYDIIVPYLL